MRKKIKRLERVLLVILSLFIVVEGCAENYVSLYIIGNKVPDEECKVQPRKEGEYLVAGTFDFCINYSYEDFGYIVNLLLENQLITTEDDQYQSESNIIRLESAYIRIWVDEVAYYYISEEGKEVAERDPVEQFLTDYDIKLSGIVEPNSYTVLKFNVFTPEVKHDLYLYFIDCLEGGGRVCEKKAEKVDYFLITVGITIIGTTLGGTEVKTYEYLYPIYVCYGCLVEGGCPTKTMCEEAEDEVEGLCYMGQDVEVPSTLLCCPYIDGSCEYCPYYQCILGEFPL